MSIFWSAEDKLRLRNLYAEVAWPDLCAAFPTRKKSAIRQMARALRLSRTKAIWSESELITLIKLFATAKTKDLMAALPLNSTTGYVVDDNGTGRVLSFAQVLEAAR